MSLIDLSDDQLKQRAREKAPEWSYNDYIDELNRRTTQRLTNRLVLATIVYAIAAVALVAVAWFKPTG